MSSSVSANFSGFGGASGNGYYGGAGGYSQAPGGPVMFEEGSHDDNKVDYSLLFDFDNAYSFEAYVDNLPSAWMVDDRVQEWIATQRSKLYAVPYGATATSGQTEQVNQVDQDDYDTNIRAALELERGIHAIAGVEHHDHNVAITMQHQFDQFEADAKLARELAGLEDQQAIVEPDALDLIDQFGGLNINNQPIQPIPTDVKVEYFDYDAEKVPSANSIVVENGQTYISYPDGTYVQNSHILCDEKKNVMAQAKCFFIALFETAQAFFERRGIRSPSALYRSLVDAGAMAQFGGPADDEIINRVKNHFNMMIHVNSNRVGMIDTFQRITGYDDAGKPVVVTLRHWMVRSDGSNHSHYPNSFDAHIGNKP